MKKIVFYLFVLVTMVGCYANRTEMTTSRDLLATLERLDMPPQDIQLWRNYLTQVDTVNQRFTGGDTLEIENIEAVTGHFSQSAPLEIAHIHNTNAVDIVTGTDTPVIFTAILQNHNGLLLWDSTDPTKLRVRGGTQLRSLFVNIQTQWESGNTGHRSIKIKMYDIDDVNIDIKFIGIDPAIGVGLNNVHNGSLFLSTPATTEYFTIVVIQTNGNNRELTFTSLGLFLYR